MSWKQSAGWWGETDLAHCPSQVHTLLLFFKSTWSRQMLKNRVKCSIHSHRPGTWPCSFPSPGSRSCVQMEEALSVLTSIISAQLVLICYPICDLVYIYHIPEPQSYYCYQSNNPYQYQSRASKQQYREQVNTHHSSLSWPEYNPEGQRSWWSHSLCFCWCVCPWPPWP